MDTVNKLGRKFYLLWWQINTTVFPELVVNLMLRVSFLVNFKRPGFCEYSILEIKNNYGNFQCKNHRSQIWYPWEIWKQKLNQITHNSNFKISSWNEVYLQLYSYRICCPWQICEIYIKLNLIILWSKNLPWNEVHLQYQVVLRLFYGNLELRLVFSCLFGCFSFAMNLVYYWVDGWMGLQKRKQKFATQRVYLGTNYSKTYSNNKKCGVFLRYWA